MCVSVLSCVQLCNPMDCSPPSSSVHGISQARILEWVAIPSSSGSFNPGIKAAFPVFPELQAILYHLSHQGKPFHQISAAKSVKCPRNLLHLPQRFGLNQELPWTAALPFRLPLPKSKVLSS